MALQCFPLRVGKIAWITGSHLFSLSHGILCSFTKQALSGAFAKSVIEWKGERSKEGVDDARSITFTLFNRRRRAGDHQTGPFSKCLKAAGGAGQDYSIGQRRTDDPSDYAEASSERAYGAQVVEAI